MQRWKDIAGWEGLYQVSDMGSVKSVLRIVPTLKGHQRVNEKILSTDVVKGYHRVTLSYEGKTRRYFVHVLVAQAFLPNPESKPCVNHLFGDKSDNRASMLEWCTRSENEKHSYEVLGKIPQDAKITLDLQTGIFYDSGTKAAVAKGMNPRTLLAQLNGQNKNKSSIIFV
jgi:hypothetical protein